MFFFGKKKKANRQTRMQLRGFPGDINTDQCLLMAAEKGIQLDVELLDVMDGACDRQDYRSISPFGKCPCLKEGGFVTSGAPAVLAYLDIRGQGGSLNPKKAAFLGEQNHWVQVAEEIAGPAVNVLMQEKVCGPMNSSGFSADAGRVDAARTTLSETMEVLDRQLAGKNFIVRDYSFADIYWTAIAHLCMLMDEGALIESHPNLKAWYGRMQARNSFASLPSLDDVKQKQLKSVA